MSTATLAAPPPTPAGADGFPEDALTEVVNGEVVEKVMGIRSTRVASRLHTRLDSFTETHALGVVVCEGMFVLDAVKNLRRRPDVAFVSTDRWPLDRPTPEEGDWELVPDLAVEVVSPGDSASDLSAKLDGYFEHGVRQVWVVYPIQKWVHVFDAPDKLRIVREADTLTTPLVPGWSLPLATLFRA